MDMYSVVSEKQRRRAMRLRMNALYSVEQATAPPKWAPRPLRARMAAIGGGLGEMTAQQREVYNGASDHFSDCPAPWDHEWLALHGDEHGELGQTYDAWLALRPPRSPRSPRSPGAEAGHGGQGRAERGQKRGQRKSSGNQKPPSVADLRAAALGGFWFPHRMRPGKYRRLFPHRMRRAESQSRGATRRGEGTLATSVLPGTRQTLCRATLPLSREAV
jgi:hypothetical protein